MALKNIFALVVVITSGACYWRYCHLSFQNKIQPVLSMWFLFCVSVNLSFLTYFSSEQHGLIAGIGNTMDLTVVWAVFLILLIARRGRFEFNGFEICCFVASGLILIFWIYTRQHVLANLALQGIMIIAYLPLFKNLYQTGKNTEPFVIWSGSLVAAAFALYPAWVEGDMLAVVYVSRAIICIGTVLILLIFNKIRRRIIEGVSAQN